MKHIPEGMQVVLLPLAYPLILVSVPLHMLMVSLNLGNWGTNKESNTIDRITSPMSPRSRNLTSMEATRTSVR